MYGSHQLIRTGNMATLPIFTNCCGLVVKGTEVHERNVGSITEIKKSVLFFGSFLELFVSIL